MPVNHPQTAIVPIRLSHVRKLSTALGFTVTLALLMIAKSAVGWEVIP